MSTSSSLKRIRERVATRLNDEFIPFLLDKAIAYHARRGIRLWCDCPFCMEKKRSIRSVQSIGRFREMYDNLPLPRYFATFNCDEYKKHAQVEDLYAWAKNRQEKQIQAIRDKLNKLKDEVI